MSAETLRDLSRSYAAGEIDRESYRVRRRDLLRRISAGEQPVTAWRPPEPEAPTVFPYDDDDEGDTTQEIMPAVTQAEAGSGLRWLVVLVVLVVLAAGAALAWIAYERLLARHEAAAPGARQPAMPGAALPAAVSPAPDDPGARFLAANDWSPARLAVLEREWLALSPPRRAALAAGDAMQRLGDTLLRRVETEAALLQTGDAAGALAAQAELLDLGARLGFDDARFARARAAWTTARAAHDAGPAAAPPPPPFEPAVPRATRGAAAPAGVTAGTVAAADDTGATPAARAGTAVDAAGADDTPVDHGARRSNCSASLAHQRRPYCIDIMDSGIKGPVLVVLPPGTFEMGGDAPSEQPRHAVNIDYPFALGMFEISAAELDVYCAHRGRRCPPQPWEDTALPAVNVDWRLARDYTSWLSEVTGARYRLPSEAEWEYAARAGSTTRYPFGDELLPTHAHFAYRGAHSAPLPASARSINRNGFRLYHMLGNVREWVADGWTGDHAGAPGDGSARAAAAGGLRVVRGGSYVDTATAARPAARVALAATSADPYTGFRVVRAIAE